MIMLMAVAVAVFGAVMLWCCFDNFWWSDIVVYIDLLTLCV